MSSSNSKIPAGISYHSSSHIEDDFSVPVKNIKAPSLANGKKMHLSLDSNQKILTVEPFSSKNSSNMLCIPNLGTRRASCPNFQAPDFHFVPHDSPRLVGKRQSIQDGVSNQRIGQFQSKEMHINGLKPSSPISEKPELLFSEDNANKSVDSSDKCVGSGETLAVQKQSGFLSSKVNSLFVPNVPEQIHSQQLNQLEKVSPSTKKKKSYLMRRAAAISNSDMNAIAPTSL